MVLAKTVHEKATRKICDLPWIKSRTWPAIMARIPEADTIKIVDLFSGCGGMTLGVMEALRQQGLSSEIKLALDLNPHAARVYKKNFSATEKNFYLGDIQDLVKYKKKKRLNKNEIALKKRLGKIDILVAGPPCQGHSNLNNHTRRSDPRNQLYLDVIRFVEVTKPKIAIIENVSSVVHDRSRVIKTSNDDLGKIGYSVHNISVNMADFALPQIRKRHIQVCIRDKEIENLNFDRFRSDSHVPVSSYLKDVSEKTIDTHDLFYTPSKSTIINQKRIDYLFKHDLYDLPDAQRPECHRNNKHSYKSSYGRIYWDRPAQTITSGFGSTGQGRYVHPLEKRVITPYEASRLQGFPDFFDFKGVTSRTELHTMIANAVPPKMIAVIITALMEDFLIELI